LSKRLSLFTFLTLALTLGSAVLPISPSFAATKPAGAVSQQAEAFTVINQVIVEDVLKSLGFEYTVKINDDGDTIFSLEISGLKSSIRIIKKGTVLLASSGFSMTNKPDMSVINAWNSDALGSRAYLDKEKDPILESDLSFDGGGTKEQLREFIRFYRKVIGTFAKHVDF
jgi:hypothetical protein